ncbi:MAG: c-type cytochrome [candidate division KSB1 bacterium]|nr:c-type cytochrome [candidate division KSB1 bacterium]MDZ7273315.1 c-type cytochrome [candidate division KSB1 bacterium]MDZ7285419.1 c-type cytochrome [candidate division KSB1 bacterium]MDZ7298450.1 c-type cytochrome [candidate division KSB1 bacterium]MDZ7348917.1 c-type cytochrome [candidate division KSB1 bacterium]
MQTARCSRHLGLGLLLTAMAMLGMGCEQKAKPTHLGPSAWNKQQWAEKTKGIRTSYNPDHDLNTETLTLVPGDERWLDFVYWSLNNKVAEHQVEAYGGTDWEGPQGGVIFHWAPGSHWETHTLASFGFTIGHIIGEHRWRDTQFPEFFEKYGGVYGVNVKDRLTEIDPKSPVPWVEFLAYCGGSDSPYYRYLFHQEEFVDPAAQKIYLIGGQGAGFAYSFERYYHEVREVLTDASAYQFFQMYDLYGPGFASRGNWAQQGLSNEMVRKLGYVDEEAEKAGAKPGVPGPTRYNPNPPAPEIPPNHPMYADIKAGQELYNQQCTPCHGIQGDGKGFLAAGFDVKPRDFRQGIYKFRSTNTGELPTLEDVERVIRVGVPNTTMPAWGQFLNDQQIHQLAVYLTIFSERFTEAITRGEQPVKIEMMAKPEAPASEMLALGKKWFDELECAKCHGQSGKGDGPSADELKDHWGEKIAATDLTYKWTFKNGHAPEDVYRTMIGGLNGTPMPSYADALPDGKVRWAVVEYILSLSPAERPVKRLADFKDRKMPGAITKTGVISAVMD